MSLRAARKNRMRPTLQRSPWGEPTKPNEVSPFFLRCWAAASANALSSVLIVAYCLRQSLGGAVFTKTEALPAIDRSSVRDIDSQEPSTMQASAFHFAKFSRGLFDGWAPAICTSHLWLMAANLKMPAITSRDTACRMSRYTSIFNFCEGASFMDAYDNTNSGYVPDVSQNSMLICAKTNAYCVILCV